MFMVRRNQNRKKLCKGSFTVEAVCVISLVMVVLMGTLYLCFFVHNRAWLTAAAYEAALTGCLEAVKEDGKVYENALAKGKELGNIGFFGAENLTMQVDVGNRVLVVYNADTFVPFAGFTWKLRAEGSTKTIKPVTRIRKIRAAAKLVDMVGGTS